MAQAGVGRRWSRRRFLGVIGAGTVLSLAEQHAARAAPPSGKTARHFDVVHDPAVTVAMTDGSRFTVTVKDRSTGTVVEQHDRVTAKNLTRLRSDHFVIVERDGP